MSENQLDFLISQLFTGGRWKSDSRINALQIKLGYVGALFYDPNTDRMVLERQVLADRRDEMGHENSLNWGRVNPDPKTKRNYWAELFDLLCPVEVDTRRSQVGGKWVNVPQIRSIDLRVMMRLLNVLIDYYKLPGDANDVLPACIAAWKENQWRTLVKNWKNEAGSSWSAHPSKNVAASRDFHPLVGLSSGLRDRVLRELGYSASADIKSAHPVLLWQAWMRVPRRSPIPLPGLETLVADPGAFRLGVAGAVAGAVGLTVDKVMPAVKEALSAMLHDKQRLPRLTADGYSVQCRVGGRRVVSVWADLGSADEAYLMFRAFCACELVRQLAADYYVIRKLIGPMFGIRTDDQLRELAECIGVEFDRLKLVINSNSPLYFLCELLETVVIESIRRSCRSENPFRVHDCVVLRRSVTGADLSEIVRSDTGYNVLFDVRPLAKK